MVRTRLLILFLALSALSFEIVSGYTPDPIFGEIETDGVIENSADDGSYSDEYSYSVARDALVDMESTSDFDISTYLENTPAPTPKPPFNVALFKPTTSSAVGYGGVASRAVDGSRDGIYSRGSVTHSKSYFYAWWQVDLMLTYLVREVLVFNRQDCCASRLNAAKLHLLDQRNMHATTVRQLSSAHQNTVTYNPPVVAQYVKIDCRSFYLSLAEVEVYGDYNAAFFGFASSSSVAHGGVAARAIDGNPSGFWASGSVTHTARESLNWWKVDLRGTYAINKVRIYNRVDCCGSRLNGGELRLSLDRGQKVAARAISTSMHGGGVADFDFDDAVEARFVNVRTWNQVLSLAEVEVYGPLKTTLSYDIMALGKQVTADLHAQLMNDVVSAKQKVVVTCDSFCEQRLYWDYRIRNIRMVYLSGEVRMRRVSLDDPDYLD
eukprot:JP446181.1.p1 GENE.JP446181.1~~JP446181.1.p1  ORF type:complete len:448 (+),score=57.12 JP446181.1:38-1345(+)